MKNQIVGKLNSQSFFAKADCSVGNANGNGDGLLTVPQLAILDTIWLYE